MSTIIIDGMNIFFQNFYGCPAGPVFGTIRSIMSYRSMGKVIVCWDGKNNIRGSYKGRKKRHKSFYEMVDDVKGYLANYICQYEAEGYEADDFIATLAWVRPRTVIVTSDRDLHQVIHPGCTVFNPISKKTFSTWLSPMRKALEGDSSDHIPSLKRKYKKTLREKMIKEFKYRWPMNWSNRSDDVGKNLDLILLKRVPANLRKKITTRIDPEVIHKKYQIRSLNYDIA